MKKMPALPCTSAEYGAVQKLWCTEILLRRRIVWKRSGRGRRCATAASAIHTICFLRDLMWVMAVVMVFIDIENYSREKGFITSIFSGWVSVGFWLLITKSNFITKLSWLLKLFISVSWACWGFEEKNLVIFVYRRRWINLLLQI